MSAHRWLNLAAIEDGRRPDVTASESAELRETRQRVRVLAVTRDEWAHWERFLDATVILDRPGLHNPLILRIAEMDAYAWSTRAPMMEEETFVFQWQHLLDSRAVSIAPLARLLHHHRGAPKGGERCGQRAEVNCPYARTEQTQPEPG